jgi:hypothetical protein
MSYSANKALIFSFDHPPLHELLQPAIANIRFGFDEVTGTNRNGRYESIGGSTNVWVKMVLTTMAGGYLGRIAAREVENATYTRKGDSLKE